MPVRLRYWFAMYAAVGVLLCGCGHEMNDGDLVWDLGNEARFAVWTPADRVIPPPEEGPALRLLAGQRVDFYLRVPNGSFLRYEGCDLGSGNSEHGLVTFQRLGEPEALLEELESSGRARSVRLPDGDDEIARLSFEAASAIPFTTPSKSPALTLNRPEIWVAASHQNVQDLTSVTSSSSEPANIVIYLVDTLRADHLGVYGFDRPTSPHLDEFARGGVVFLNALAQSSWTKPSVASIFTGLDADAHGVLDNDSTLPESLTTIAEVLSEHGYWTGGIQTNHIVGEKFNFGQGFNHYVKGGHRVNAIADRLLEERDSTKPVFLYAHTIRPHNPYRPAPEFKERFAADVPLEYGETEFLKSFRFKRAEPSVERGIADLYDAEIAYNDQHFGEFLEILRAHGLYENSLIIFLSDHGEELWDHGGWGHGHTLYREVVRVPFVLKEPCSSRTGRDGSLVQLIDVFPTVLDYAGLPIPASLPGASLRSASHSGRSRVSVSSVEPHGNIPDAPMVAIENERWKLIQTSEDGGSPTLELFDLAADPLEANNVLRVQPIAAGFMQVQLTRHRVLTEGLANRQSAEMDEETLNQLRALGYVQ